MPTTRIGLVSDTHGHLDSALWRLFDGVEAILHAGDIGDLHLVRELESIAPVSAIRGNTDATSHRFPETLTTTIGEITVHVRHKVDTTSPMLYYLAATVEANLVLFGHTHRPFIEQVKRTLFVNPGSVGRSRTGFGTAGLLLIEDRNLTVTIHNLEQAEFPVVMRSPASPTGT